MLLPSFLKDSYKQYKDDTNRFATWLVNIAKKVGKPFEEVVGWIVLTLFNSENEILLYP